MKIIFLDIDGVLVTLDSFTLKGAAFHGQAQPECVVALNAILKTTGAKIVVSSAWRARGRLGRLRRKFSQWGIHAAKSRTIGMTPELDRQNVRSKFQLPRVSRGQEIQHWLDNHPGVEAFVILDDDDDMEHLTPYLVRSTFETGLTGEHAARAIHLLTSGSL